MLTQVLCQSSSAEAQAKKQLEEDKRKRKAEQQKRQMEIDKQKLQQATASKTKSQKKEVVESKPTAPPKTAFSLFGKGLSTKQKEEVPALIKSPVTSQHGNQSTPRKATPKSPQVKKKLFDWKAPKWKKNKGQDKSNPKAQVQQQEKESKLGSVTVESKAKESKDDELHDKEAKSSSLWKLIICSYAMVLLSSIIISQRGHICNRNNRYLSPLLLCPVTELPNKINKRKKNKMKKQSV